MEPQRQDGWEKTIVRNVLSGDSESFREIVIAYGARLRSFCRSRLPASEVDDAMQDVFLKAFKSLKTYDSRYGFSTWFFTVAHSLIAGRKLRFKRELEKIRNAIAFRDDRPALNEGQDNLEADQVRALVSRLDERSRSVVELYYFACLSVQEISGVLSIGESAVKVRLFRARKALATMMETGNRKPSGGV